MNKLTRRAILATPAALILSACPSTRTPSPAIAPDQTVQLPQPQPSEPGAVIGLMFDDGTSKGFAHTGIIKILKESGTPVKVITGASAGSIVDSLYASGISPDRLEPEAEILDKTDSIDLTLLTSSFIEREKLQNYISYKVGSRPIQQFPLKFTAVATDFETDKAAAFNRDDAGQAMRASASVPNVFQPVMIGSHECVDSGLPQPVPISTAKARGANFVIVVDISTRLTKNVSQSLFSYLNQTLSIMSTSALHSELGKADVVIESKVPELGSVGGFDRKSHAI